MDELERTSRAQNALLRERIRRFGRDGCREPGEASGVAYLDGGSEHRDGVRERTVGRRQAPEPLPDRSHDRLGGEALELWCGSALGSTRSSTRVAISAPARNGLPPVTAWTRRVNSAVGSAPGARRSARPPRAR